MLAGDYYAPVSAVVLEPKRADYLPGVRRIDTSLVPNPPEGPAWLADAMVGTEFFRSVPMSDGASRTYTYRFLADGTVLSRSVYGGSVSFQNEERGTYEVIGGEIEIVLGSDPRTFDIHYENGRVTALFSRSGQRYSMR